MRHFFIILAALAALTACDRSHDGKLDESYETQLLDIVTYTGLDADKHATFRLEGRDDEPGVDLLTTIGAPDKVKEHNRVLLNYTIDHKSPSGDYWKVNTISISRIINDSLRVNTKPLDNYEMRPIRLTSTWRSGEYINVHGQVEFTGKNRLLYMMADDNTRNNDTVHAYLVHDLLNTSSDSIYYWRDFYLSVNVGVLRNSKVPCKVLSLHLNNDNNPEVKQYNFKIK